MKIHDIETDQMENWDDLENIMLNLMSSGSKAA